MAQSHTKRQAKYDLSVRMLYSDATRVESMFQIPGPVPCEFGYKSSFAHQGTRGCAWLWCGITVSRSYRVESDNKTILV